MADIVDEIETHLKTITAITDLLGTGNDARIYRDTLRQNATLPSLVLVVSTGGEMVMHLGGLADIEETVLHAYAYGSTRSQAGSVDDAVLADLCSSSGLDCRGTINATFVHTIRPSQRFWEHDNSLDHNRTRRYITRRAYTLTHQ